MKTNLALAILALAYHAYADSATWNLNPASNDWNLAQNWTPQTIPSSATDVATFQASNIANLICGDAPGGEGTNTIVGTIVFASGASAYTITITPVFDNDFPSIVEVHEGITNNSGKVQKFVVANSGTTRSSARLYFMGSANAGVDIVATNQGGAVSGVYGAFTQFWDTASAGSATFISNGGLVLGAHSGFTDLLDESSAESATFISNPAEAVGADAAYTLVQTTGNIGTSSFIANPANVPDAEAGRVYTDYGTAAGASFIANGATVANCQAGQIYTYGLSGYATYTGKGGTGSGSEGGLIDISSLPPSAQTLVVAEAGINGGLGGNILVGNEAPVDLAQFQVFGNGTLDLDLVTQSAITIGSLSGDGSVLLAGQTLRIGNNNLDTTFSGIMQGSGGIAKLGTGTLTLAGANTYSGTTIVAAGTLLLTNQSGSGTGSGAIKVKSGTLGGSGIIAGAVTIGSGSGTGAFLAPAINGEKQLTLTTQSALALNSDATYTYTFKATKNQSRTDLVIANGVTINGASFNLLGTTQGNLKRGLTLTVISNTSANPISGTFANLPDGGIVTVNGNNLQASYKGGDGNDLTLTVVP
jgi:autotransporter-associated beta strand protein